MFSFDKFDLVRNYYWRIFILDSERCGAGYEDGTLRLFDLSKVDLEAKFTPHCSSVSAIAFSIDGLRIKVKFPIVGECIIIILNMQEKLLSLEALGDC